MTYRPRALLRSAAVALLCGAALACGDVGLQVPGPDGGGASIQFGGAGVLTMAPKQTAVIDLSAAGVSNATLALAGNYLDAFLESDHVDVSSGEGQVTLHAPSTPTTFSVLATGQGASARLDVSVSATGFADVRVTVSYEGKRAVPLVAASTFIETTCAQIAGKTTDGSPLVLGTYGEQLVIGSVPTDGQVAVAVRIAHYAIGCVDVASLTPGETRDVTVPVFDLPLDLASSTLETRFTFSPDAADELALQSYFGQYVDGAVLAASFSSTSNEAGRLLDAMQTASANPTFATARSQKSWDSATASWLAQYPPSMHDRVAQWLAEATQAGVGDLTGHLDASPSKPLFTPKMLGAIDAPSAGVSAPLPFAWSGQPNDLLSISGVVAILPSKLACAGADLRAAADAPPATGVADALATAIDCNGLGAALAQGGYAFGQCDGACVASLCATALADIWTAGRESLTKSSDVLTLALSVAAPALVVDTPQVQSFVGPWVGSFGYGSSQVGTKGTAKGAFGAIPN